MCCSIYRSPLRGLLALSDSHWKVTLWDPVGVGSCMTPLPKIILCFYTEPGLPKDEVGTRHLYRKTHKIYFVINHNYRMDGYTLFRTYSSDTGVRLLRPQAHPPSDTSTLTEDPPLSESSSGGRGRTETLPSLTPS